MIDTAQTPLEELAAAKAKLDAAKREFDAAFEACVDQGYRDFEIVPALGLSKQAVQARRERLMRKRKKTG